LSYYLRSAYLLLRVAAMNHLRFIAETLANGMETNATLTLRIQT